MGLIYGRFAQRGRRSIFPFFNQFRYRSSGAVRGIRQVVSMTMDLNPVAAGAVTSHGATGQAVN